MTKENFIWSIIASIIATIILNIIVFFIKKVKNRKRNILNKRIKEADIKTFFYNRKVLREDSGVIGEEIAHAEKNVYLIGSWLSTALNENFEKAIFEKVEAGVEFFFCFNDLNLNVIEVYSNFINGSKENVIKSLFNTYSKLFEIKYESAEIANKIHIHYHNQMLPTTFWGIDINSNRQYYKLDHKVIKGEISSSYGLQFGYSKDFSENIEKAYMYVFNNSTEIDNISKILSDGKIVNNGKDCSILDENFKY